MTLAVLMAATASAFLNAFWNLLAQQNHVPRDSLYGLTLATAAMCSFAFPFFGPPAPETWPWIGMASVANIAYLQSLGQAYVFPGFAVVYAVIRSIVPAILFLSGWIAFGETERLGPFIGVAVVIGSILVFAIPQDRHCGLDLKTLSYSLFAGLLLAAALLLDVKGIRVGGDGLVNLVKYTIASSLTTAAGLITLGFAKRKNTLAILLSNGRQSFLGAILLISSYIFGMWAYSRGPIGLVAPVRECSILFGGALSVILFRQCVTRVQWVAMVLATIGIVLVQAG